MNASPIQGWKESNMDYIYSGKSHYVVACLYDGTKKVVYSHLEKSQGNTYTYEADYSWKETNYGTCRYTSEFYNSYDEYDEGAEDKNICSSKEEYLKSLRLKDLYSIFIESETEEDEEDKEDVMNMLVKNGIEPEDIDYWIVYVAFQEYTEGFEEQEYCTDFVIDKKSAEEWKKFSEKKKEKLENDFSYHVFYWAWITI